MDDLLAPSSLLSSRWSRDNLITCHPAQLYGRVVERVDPAALGRLIQELEGRLGPIQVGPGRMGVVTWDIACAGAGGPFVLQAPLALDEPGASGRARREVPRHNADNMRAFRARGLGRFVVEPREALTLAGGVPAATFAALPDHRPIAFGRGALHVQLAEGELDWLVSLGPAATAELLAEMIAALAYHYDADADGGTALTDVFVNDGDFVVRRGDDGAFDVRLTAARRRESGIGPDLLLLYLCQLLAYEDWTIGGDLVGLPAPMSNPSLAFAGLVRGRAYRSTDLGAAAEAGRQEALAWIHAFGRSREGRAYRPWVERFLAGDLLPAFGAGGDPRERWWRLTPLQTKLGVLDLQARRDPQAAAAARALAAFVERLSREVGRAADGEPAALPLNDLGRDALAALLTEAGVAPPARDGVVRDLLARWPYRSLDHLAARVPGAAGLRRLRSRLGFGRVVATADQGTLASLGPAPKEAGPARAVANPETFGGPPLAPALQAAAVETFPTFEAFMDAALHDPTWGYYARSVAIGRGGHFITNPESLSPRYGRWIATWAFRMWREMIARGELGATDPFPIIEFGAGNGRLARDVLDAVAQDARAAAEGAGGDDGRRAFAARLAYRVYETSPSLRERQHALLGGDAIVAEGDARRPAATLARDFPDGVRGLVLTNEVPDAFGVHKLVLTADGDARATLVVPRVEARLCDARDAIDGALARRIADADASARRTFGFTANAGDLYLDGATWAALMAALAALPAERRAALLGALWCEELPVAAAAVPELAAHLSANAAASAVALAAADTGVTAYANVHADRFVRELGSSLRAGFVVTIDYGDTTWGLVEAARRGEFPFRVYGADRDFVPRPNDPYALPGTQDMTADVGFTALARAGEDAGLTVVHFGPERDLAGDDLPALLQAAAAGDESVAEFLGNPVFKVLVLATRPSDLFSGPLMSPLAITRGARTLPKSRRARAAAIEQRLRTTADFPPPPRRGPAA
ncbi:MAG TPA: SAM-dependent methyltransferase [Polyangia bacterium]